jgi:Na+/H+ antiporter NhaD/arsenite permease-like protein
MSLAAISLGALVVVIIASCTIRLNVGLLSIVLAWIVGVYIGGLKLADVMAGFPASLFLTLTGVTLLFTQAHLNGTLDKVARWAVSGCRGNAGLIPIVFFILAAGLSSMGPGNIATAALLAPMAMAVAARAGIPAFLMAIMVGNGANSGSLSPFAPTGIIVNGLMSRIGMAGVEWQTYVNNLIAHSAVAFAGYFLFGGWKLFRKTYPGRGLQGEIDPEPFQARHWVTLGVVFALLTSVVFLEVNIGMAAFAGAMLLILSRLGNEAEAIAKMPWGVILMVSGVTVLISLLEKTQGLDLFTSLLARFSTRDSVTGVIAFVTGLVSVYSSTSGVVLPAFLPTIPGLIERLGGGDPLAIASSMNVGSHLVDVSPLSTIGALCLASLPLQEDSRALFNKLLVWGLSMSVVGALACYFFFGR